MASAQTKIDQNTLQAIRKEREELIQTKSEVLVRVFRAVSFQSEIKAIDEEIRRAIARCPKRQTGSVEALEEQIADREHMIETSSLNPKQERDVCILRVV